MIRKLCFWVEEVSRVLAIRRKDYEKSIGLATINTIDIYSYNSYRIGALIIKID